MATRSRSQSTLRQPSFERPGKLNKSNTASRNASPGYPNRRIAKLNMYLSKSAKNSSDQLHCPSTTIPIPPRVTCVRRWDGNRRTTIKWDSVRRVCPRRRCFPSFRSRFHLTIFRTPNCGIQMETARFIFMNMVFPGEVPLCGCHSQTFNPAIVDHCCGAS